MNPYESDFSEERSDRPCGLCGGDAFAPERVNGKAMPVCDDCYHNQIETCADCGEKWTLDQMERVFGTSNLYCPRCARHHPVIAQGRMAELHQDEARGK